MKEIFIEMKFKNMNLFPIEPMNGIDMSKEMEDFIAMYCMMGIMPMHRNNPLGFITPMPWLMDEEDDEFRILYEEEWIRDANENEDFFNNDFVEQMKEALI